MKKVLMTCGVLMSATAFADKPGCYLGVNGSYGQGNNQWTTTFISGEARDQNAGSTRSFGSSVGVHGGCDWALSSDTTLGFRLSHQEVDVAGDHVYVGGTSPQNVISYETDQLQSVVAKMGYQWHEKGLLYATLGWATSDQSYRDDDPLFNPIIAFRQEDTRDGWQLGFGYEYRLSDHFSVFAEYSHTEFGDDGILLIDTSSVNIFDYEADVDQDLKHFMLGVNFHF